VPVSGSVGLLDNCLGSEDIWNEMLVSTAVVLIILVGLFIWWASKGLPYNLDSIEPPLAALLKRGYDGGLLVIEIGLLGRRFLQLRKYIHAPGDYGIELGFPRATWSRKLFPQIEAFYSKFGIKYKIQRNNGMDFLYVDFGRDLALAHRCIRKMLADIFGVQERTKLFAKLENASSKDELICE
jgi:hypothetical protein